MDLIEFLNKCKQNLIHCWSQDRAKLIFTVDPDHDTDELVEIDNLYIKEFWLKNYKCHHVISCAYRLKLLDFNSIGMDLPIQNKRKERWRIKNALKSVQVQQSDLTNNVAENMIYDDLKDDSETAYLSKKYY